MYGGIGHTISNAYSNVNTNYHNLEAKLNEQVGSATNKVLITGLGLTLVAMMYLTGCSCNKPEQTTKTPAPIQTSEQTVPVYNPPATLTTSPTYPATSTTQTPTKPTTSTLVKPDNLEAKLDIKYEPLNKQGSVYNFKLIIKEENGVDVMFDKLLMKLISQGKEATYDRAQISKSCGSYTLKGNEKWELDWGFFSEQPDTYVMSWEGTDSKGNTVKRDIKIPTSDFK
jgi:hypothetical protein